MLIYYIGEQLLIVQMLPRDGTIIRSQSLTSAAFNDLSEGIRKQKSHQGLSKCHASFILRSVAPKLRLFNRKQVYTQISPKEI